MNTARNMSKPRVANQAAGVGANLFLHSVIKTNRLRIIKKEAETFKQYKAGGA
jgi:hypothetical protein